MVGRRDSGTQGCWDTDAELRGAKGLRAAAAVARLLSTLTSPPHCALQDLTFLTKQEILQ